MRDPETHQMVVEEITRFAMNNGYDVKNLDFSPITGGEGNIEFLAHLVSVEGEGYYIKRQNPLKKLSRMRIKN